MSSEGTCEKSEEVEYSFLCLLDRSCLNPQDRVLPFGDYELKYFGEGELKRMFSGQDAACPVVRRSGAYEKYEQTPWAVYRRTSDPPNAPAPGSSHDLTCDQLTRMLSVSLSVNHSWSRCYFPFDELIDTLNLLKPNAVPLRPIQFYKFVDLAGRTPSLVEHIILGEPTVWPYEDGKLFYPNDHTIDESDACAYSSLAQNIRTITTRRHTQSGQSHEAATASPSSAEAATTTDDRGVESPTRRVGSMPPSDHIAAALKFFRAGDRHFFLGEYHEESVIVLILYEAAIEALLIREKERAGTGDKLKRRVSKAIPGRGAMKKFVEELFWLRSKITHGAMPLDELASRIGSPLNERFKSLFTDLTGPTNEFLSCTRELARLCIRFSMDRWLQGCGKDKVISELEERRCTGSAT